MDETKGQPLGEGLSELHGRLQRIVNDDLMNLRIVMAALAFRLNDTGLVERERLTPGWESAMTWVREHGLTRASEHMIIGMWSALEVYVEDVFVLYCTTTSPPHEQLPNVRVKAAESMSLTDDEQWRTIFNRADAGGVAPVDRWDAIFKPLGIRIELDVIRVPGSESIWMDGDTVRRVLRELAEVRNAFVHRGGVADRRVVAVAGSRYLAGERIVIRDDALIEYGNAIWNYSAALGAAVDPTIEVT